MKRTIATTRLLVEFTLFVACVSCVSGQRSPHIHAELEDAVCRLKTTRMPRFDFRQAPIADILDFWQESINSTNLTPEHRDGELRIVVDPHLRIQELPLMTICHRGDLTFMDTLAIVCSICDIRFRIKGDSVLLMPGPALRDTVRETSLSNSVLQDTANGSPQGDPSADPEN